MAYDPRLAHRIRAALASDPSVAERKMFGGLAFLVRGHMAVAASSKGGLMVRADPATTADLVETTRAEYVEMRGRQLQGWLYVDSADIRSGDELATWIDRAVSYSATLDQKTRPTRR